MTFALVLNDTITAEGNLPRGAQRLDTGQWVTPPGGVWTDAQAAACGWLPVVDSPRPADTATTTSDRTIAVVAGKPTVTWTARDKTPGEIAGEARMVELATLRDNIVTKAITFLEADAAAAQARADSITGAITTVQGKRTTVQGFTFNGATVAAINGQLNTALKPMLVDMLTYTIQLAQLVEGIEQWRGTKADPALVWLARHTTETPGDNG